MQETATYRAAVEMQGVRLLLHVGSWGEWGSWEKRFWCSAASAAEADALEGGLAIRTSLLSGSWSVHVARHSVAGVGSAKGCYSLGLLQDVAY